MTELRFPPGTFTPAPGRGRVARMLWTQTRTETALALRNGEQVLLTLIIPLALLIGLSTVRLFDVPEPRIAWVAPRILALAVMSTAFTGQAISLGFDRRYGVLKRLAATAIPRWTLATGRVLSTLAVVAVQLVVLGTVAALLGWSPTPTGIAYAIAPLLLGVLAFGALGVLLGGSVRAEIVLVLANAVWFLLLLAGGIAVPLSSLPTPLATAAQYLPSGALAESLGHTLTTATPPAATPLLVLAAWAAIPTAIATRTTRLD